MRINPLLFWANLVQYWKAGAALDGGEVIFVVLTTSTLHGVVGSNKITKTLLLSMKLLHFLGGIDVMEGVVRLEGVL
eukprot:755148-Ditylum_brightwellii.AAC.3